MFQGDFPRFNPVLTRNLYDLQRGHGGGGGSGHGAHGAHGGDGGDGLFIGVFVVAITIITVTGVRLFLSSMLCLEGLEIHSGSIFLPPRTLPPLCCTLVPLLQNPPTPQLSLRILKLSRISAQNRTDSNFCAGQKCARIFYSVFTHHKIEKRPPCCLENLEDMHVLKNCIQNSKESHFLQSRTGTKHVLPTCEGTKNANCQLL